MAKPILISLSPNTDAKDTFLALKTTLSPFTLKKGESLDQLTKALKQYFKLNHCWLLNSGRSGLTLAIKSLDLKPSDEVLCQALTCVAVPNAILHSNLKPIYIDTVKKGFNMSASDLAKKITPNSKAIIVQHNFGTPDDLDSIIKLAKKHRLTIIEDCAHSLGASYKDKQIGTFGDLTVLSFGRDKVISSIFGGALLTKNYKRALKIDQLTSSLNYPSNSWTLKQLLHPIIMSLAVPLYFTLSIGKLIIFFYQKSGLLELPVSQKEKNCQLSLPILKLPNALATLALYQFRKLEKLNNHRQSIAKLYSKSFNLTHSGNSTYLRFPLLVKNPTQLIKKAKKKNILLGNWYRPVISPEGVNLKKAHYIQGSCPNAESSSQSILNLPTHPRMNLKDAKKIVKLIKNHANY